MPAWPPGALCSTRSVRKPLRGAVHRGGQPRRARADDDQIVEGPARPRLHPAFFGQLAVARRDEAAAVGKEEDRQPARVSDGADQLPRRRVLVHVDPLVGNLVAREELLDRVAPRRGARAGDPDAVVGKARLRLPVRQQVVQDRIEALFRRIPGLQEVVIEAHVVDAGDRGLRVGIGRQEDPARLREELERLAQELRAGHLGHPLVHEEERDGSAALLQLPGGLEGFAAGAGLEHPVVAAVVLAQVALDRAQHLRVVVDGQNYRSDHVSPCPRRSAASR